MALQLDYALPSGLIANYWRIEKVRLDFVVGIGQIEVALYKDASACSGGLAPVLVNIYDFVGFVGSISPGNTPITLAYTRLKTLDMFSTATDV